MRLARAFVLVVHAAFLLASPAYAQEAADERPAFSLSTSEVFTTRDAPHFYLTFRRIAQLDFRVYKVRDPFAFFAGLDDPHSLGTSEANVEQQRTWLERFADWKRGQRQRVRQFARTQASHNYRAARRAVSDKAEVAQRVVLNASTFAQVPLLNADQVVTTWRELLPNNRDTEVRRVPVDLKQSGVYVVEAVSELLRAYTIVMVSDMGIVTKTSPGQMVFFTADRFSGEPAADCSIRVVFKKKTIAEGRTNADGLFEATLPDERIEDVIGVAQCGNEVAATDPGSWTLGQPARELAAYVYTDKPIYRPGHTVHLKAILRWKQADALVPSIDPRLKWPSPIRTTRSCSAARSNSMPSAPSMRVSRCRQRRRSAPTRFGSRVATHKASPVSKCRNTASLSSK
jgi:alpha-2-macroglobulin